MTTKEYIVQPYEHEPAGNAYLMSTVAVIAGLPLPIINVIASVIFYLSNRKASYYVRWHSLQALIAQAVVMPFNSIALAWTIRIFFEPLVWTETRHNHYEAHFNENLFDFPSAWYFIYIFFVLALNLFEFIGVLITAVAVRKGKNVRWAIIANITDRLCSKENRDPYAI
ncbi:hypothetical protein AM493_01565 [Flavobacterium akiainvivens]|uniref:DUF4870 domain-containing protein n=1 Tax=Flavobacterium akiainvivens TaxID=1202724 RepID=A0A0N0RQD0_9FLAO|nr:DUF4870 domain-containing protein [Flavobacterium akiainvivens]KOS04872.1 hypothetical protein AM493_01565 [Flavobacterium akiainvivens]SFQ42907.1 hypothetical protein SAMN05444144_104209 [Flavobacterium akiainvivens]